MSKGLFPALRGEINSVIWKIFSTCLGCKHTARSWCRLTPCFQGVSRPEASGGQDGTPERSQDTPSRGAWAPTSLSTLGCVVTALWRLGSSLQALLRQIPEVVSASALFTYSNTRRGDLGFLVKLGFPILHQEQGCCLFQQQPAHAIKYNHSQQAAMGTFSHTYPPKTVGAKTSALEKTG